jgi:hypothetical protein
MNARSTNVKTLFIISIIGSELVTRELCQSGSKLCHTKKLRQLFENDIGEVHASERKICWRISTGRAEREYLGILTLVLESSIRLSKLDTSNPKQA